jgi:hypothetical protein
MRRRRLSHHVRCRQPPAARRRLQLRTNRCPLPRAPLNFNLLPHLTPLTSFPPPAICPKLPPGSASILSANVTETLTGLVKVKVQVNVSKVPRLHSAFHPCSAPLILAPSRLRQPTAAGAVELRLICPPLVGAGMDVLLPKFVALAVLRSCFVVFRHRVIIAITPSSCTMPVCLLASRSSTSNFPPPARHSVATRSKEAAPERTA